MSKPYRAFHIRPKTLKAHHPRVPAIRTAQPPLHEHHKSAGGTFRELHAFLQYLVIRSIRRASVKTSRASGTSLATACVTLQLPYSWLFGGDRKEVDRKCNGASTAGHCHGWARIPQLPVACIKQCIRFHNSTVNSDGFTMNSETLQLDRCSDHKIQSTDHYMACCCT